MSGSTRSRSHRTRGSSTPRIAGVGVVVLLAAGGLAFYARSPHHSAPPPRRHASLSSRVLRVETVGLIAFGPSDDGDQSRPGIDDDHPLMLQPTRGGMSFVKIPPQQLGNGSPEWTVNEMADGSVIFIYDPTGQCLTATDAVRQILLAHCNLQLSQRWRPVHAMTVLGQAFATYAAEKAGLCLTAPAVAPEGQRSNPGLAALTVCGQARDKSQEIAFWWGA